MDHRSFLSFLLLCFLLLSVSAEQCNASHMNFLSHYSLGKQDQFNRSFTKVQQKLPTIATVNYTAPDGYHYTISDVKAVFYYRGSKQKATPRGDDVVFIEGGTAQVDITFTWHKQSSMSPVTGSGSASALSEELTLGKKLIVENNSYSYKFLDAFPFTLPDDAFNITRIEPASTSRSQIGYIKNMLNSMADKKDVKGHLQQAVSEVYNDCINESIHDEHFPISLTFQYKWVPNTHRPNVTMAFVRRPTSVDVQKIGLISTFDIQAANAAGWTCGTRKVLQMPLEPRIFGGIQEFISFDFYEQVLQQALHQGILNSDLDEYTWGHRMFQFYAGDLYQVFSGVAGKYYASEKVKGQCLGNPSGLTVFKNNQMTFNVTLKHACNLEVRNEQITTFSISLELVVAGRPKSASLDFEVVAHSQTVFFHPDGQYQLINKGLAEAMVADSLNRLYDGDLFGCGWPQSPPKDYPHFRVEENYTAIFDHSMIDPPLQSIS